MALGVQRLSSMPLTPMGALRVFDRKEWARRVKSALKGNTYDQAAVILGVLWRTVVNWAKELDAQRPSGVAGWRKHD